MLNGDHPRLSEYLFGEVVDQLSVDEARNTVVNDLLALVAHLLLLRLFNFRYFGHAIDTHTGPCERGIRIGVGVDNVRGGY